MSLMLADRSEDPMRCRLGEVWRSILIQIGRCDLRSSEMKHTADAYSIALKFVSDKFAVEPPSCAQCVSTITDPTGLIDISRINDELLESNPPQSRLKRRYSRDID